VAAEVKPKFRWPLGLLVVLVVYSGLVLVYVQQTYWSSPDYQAAQSYAKGLTLLGPEDGRRCSEADLRAGTELLIVASRLQPNDRSIADHLEHVRWVFDERKLKLPPDVVRAIELVSMNVHRAELEKQGFMPIGLRTKGWAPEQLLGGPQRALLFSIPGFVLIFAFWGYTRWTARAVHFATREALLKKEEQALEELGHFRRIIKEEPAATPPSPPPTHDDAPAPAPRGTGTRPPLKRKPPT
jgi:hypothetical protein